LTLQVEAYRGLTKRKDVRTLDICRGIAALTENIFRRKLNHVTGLGIGTPVSVDAVEQLELVLLIPKRRLLSAAPRLCYGDYLH
jgi:hypothetical protein